jgi:outer membrane lipoprotein-sorting protein
VAIHYDSTRSVPGLPSQSRRAQSPLPALILSLAALLAFASGCSVSQKKAVKPSEARAPLLTATRDELIAQYNKRAEAVNSLNASVSMKLTAGSEYSGVIENYHEVDGFILAVKPSSIRVIGQAPVVGKNVFDMVSDGQAFHIFIPSKAKFLVGPVDLKRPAKKPIENLRPQHLIDALLWNPIAPPEYALFEEAVEPSGHFYILTVVRPAPTNDETPGNSPALQIVRKIWFDRTNLLIVRVETYAQQGKLVSDAHYSAWEAAGDTKYPPEISIARPADDYELHITINKVTLNEPIAPDRFILAQPPGTELVDIATEPKDAQPSESKSSESKQ